MKTSFCLLLSCQAFVAAPLRSMTELSKSVKLLTHEIENSLMVVGGFAQRLYKNFPEGDAKREEAAIILNEMKRLEVILKSYSNLGELRLPELKNSNINEVVKKTLSFMNYEMERNKIKCFTDLNPTLPEVMADEYQIRQVLLNIIHNGIQAMKDGGEFHVKTSVSDNFVQISVADAGVGIPENLISKIFDPFFTTKKDGMGIGLTISREIIEAHNGSISVESQLNVGTTFTINLPTETDEEVPEHSVGNISEDEAPKQNQNNNERSYSDAMFYLKRMKPSSSRF